MIVESVTQPFMLNLVLLFGAFNKLKTLEGSPKLIKSNFYNKFWNECTDLNDKGKITANGKTIDKLLVG